MKQHHGWDIEELESMQPWEREINVGMTAKWVAEENARMKEQERKAKSKSRY